MKVAAIQMVSAVAREANLARAHHLLAQAREGGAELAVLPEYFCTMGMRDTDKLELRESPDAGMVQGFLADAAREFGMWIVGGTLPLESPEEGHVLNTSLAYSPEGQCVARYDKIHLFYFDNGREHYDERRVITPGTQPVVFELPSRDGHAWQVGMSVCYDLRFPELYRALSRAGAQLLLVPSAFTWTTGSAHWEVLLRARAIENLAWVVAPAQGGEHENGRRTWGQSLVADPWGTVQAQQATGEGVVLCELDFGHVQSARQRLPALSHRVL
ncbi:carbon-nitrogen hydrolase family protein [Variovorax dokdonensis]|uniref:Carbon-nitrogen hydrolase family protein n=1 Tax=Variovorax dokdonensis TaxID=344883 RepID=A0ABT7N9N5_9BURK|nr:carbon-nitrogen hydrolase family protein [Variovorax dokdonensis]MDM0044657.1 carbon-nitrogen hydrolase family protein [Variovorax dokdonensis]